MKTSLRYVVTTYKPRRIVHWQEIYYLPEIEKALQDWMGTPNKTISISCYHKDYHLLPKTAMCSSVVINMDKLKVTYGVVCTTNKNKYRNYSRIYSTVEDLVFSVINYLTICQETKMTYSDILTSGEN